MLLELAAMAALATSAQDHNGWPATVVLECEEQAAALAEQQEGRWIFQPGEVDSPDPVTYTIDVANARYQNPEDPRIHYPVDVQYGSLRIQYDLSLLAEFAAPNLVHYIADPQASSGLYVRTVNTSESSYTVVGECRRIS